MKSYLKNISRYQNHIDRSKYEVFLKQNERNFELPEKLFDRFKFDLKQEDIFFYPDLSELYTNLAKFYGVNKNCLLVTPGSDYGIKTVFEAFDLNQNTNVLTTGQHFPMYQVYCDIFNTKLRTVPYRGMLLHTTDIVDSINKDTKIILLANPNSPIGDAYNHDGIKKLLDTGVHVVVDEAYIELSEVESCVSLIKEYKNLTVLRTFSKAFGAAGLRVGTLISHPENIDKFYSKLRLMYEINSIGVKYVNYMLSNLDYFLDYFAHTLSGKNQLVQIFTDKGYTIEDSKCNWFFIQRIQNGKDFVKFFEDLKIDVKECKLPDRKFSWIKLNYDITLENYNIPELL